MIENSKFTKIDEEFDRYRREDPVIQHPGEPAEYAAEDPELPAVTHLKKLCHGQTPGFPEPVIDPAGNGDYQTQRSREKTPPYRGKTCHIVLLKVGNYTDSPDPGNTAGDRQQITPRTTVGSQKVCCTFNISLTNNRKIFRKT